MTEHKNDSDVAGSSAKSAGLNGPASMLLAEIAAIATVLGIMAAPLFCGRVNMNNDLGWLHLPTRIFYANCLARGQAFDWIPEMFSGFYLTGSGDIAGYHPFHWLLYRWLPLQAAFEIEIVAAYPFLLLGMFVWLRRLRMPREVAAAGAMVFTFSSFCMLHFLHPNMVSVAAHLPWLLAAIDVVVKGDGPIFATPRAAGGRGVADIVHVSAKNGTVLPPAARRTAAALAIALLTGSQLLLGHPQTVWLSLVVEAPYAMILLLWRAKKMPSRGAWLRWAARTCLVLGFSVGLGGMLGAVQVLPMADLAALSVRNATTAEFADSLRLDPLNVVQLVAPYMFQDRVVQYNTHEFGLYAGAVPLMLIFWLRGRSKELGPLRGVMWAALALFALGLDLSFGNWGLLYRLQRFLPLARDFRCSCRYLMLTELAAAVLAALGLLLLLGQLRAGRKAAWRELAPLGFVVVLSVVVAAVGMVLRLDTELAWVMASPLEILAGPLVFAAAALLFILAARGWRIGAVALIAFTALDLGFYGLSYTMPSWNIYRIQDFLLVAPPPPQESAAGGSRQSRIFFNENPPACVNCTHVDGYAQLLPARQLDYLRLDTLQAAATDWVWRNKKNAGIGGLRDRGGAWLEVPDPLPAVRMVSRARASSDPAGDLPKIDWRNTVLTEEAMDLPPAPAGNAQMVDRRPGRFELTTDAPSQQILAIAESYHPGWRAMVDGTSRPVFRVNGDFLGCLVGPGKQHVMFVFQPASLRYGWRITLAAVAICSAWTAWLSLLAAVAMIARRRNHRQSSGIAATGDATAATAARSR